MPKIKEKGHKLQIVNFKADPELIRWIKGYAADHNTYTSEVIRYALEKLRFEEQKEKSPNRK